MVEHTQNLVQEEADKQTWNTIVESEIINLLSDYIRHLPGECAKIMELVMQGYNSTEISSLTGASSSTVRSQKQRGISLLKMITKKDTIPIPTMRTIKGVGTKKEIMLLI